MEKNYVKNNKNLEKFFKFFLSFSFSFLSLLGGLLILVCSSSRLFSPLSGEVLGKWISFSGVVKAKYTENTPIFKEKIRRREQGREINKNLNFPLQQQKKCAETQIQHTTSQNESLRAMKKKNRGVCVCKGPGAARIRANSDKRKVAKIPAGAHTNSKTVDQLNFSTCTPKDRLAGERRPPFYIKSVYRKKQR